MKTRLFLTAAVVILLAGCKPESNVEPIDVYDLLGEWLLVQPDKYPVTLHIEPIVQTWEKLPVQVFSLSGISAVNQYSSSLSYVARNQRSISIGSISGTYRAGTAEAAQFDEDYYNNLKTVTRYELTENNRLQLYYNGGVLIYTKTN
ncbi:META domain-containing protein [Spirosoma koreense]